jgi:hypothetical protein
MVITATTRLVVIRVPVAAPISASQSQSYDNTDGQSASLSWCQDQICIITSGALSDKKTGL